MQLIDQNKLIEKQKLNENIDNYLKLGNKYLENYILNINKETYKANDKRNELRDIIISKLFRYFFAMENFIMF